MCRRIPIAAASAVAFAVLASSASARPCPPFGHDYGYLYARVTQLNATGVPCQRAVGVIVVGMRLGDQFNWRWNGWRFHTVRWVGLTRTMRVTKRGKKITFRLTQS